MHVPAKGINISRGNPKIGKAAILITTYSAKLLWIRITAWEAQLVCAKSTSNLLLYDLCCMAHGFTEAAACTHPMLYLLTL